MVHTEASTTESAVEDIAGDMQGRPLTKFPNLFRERIARNDGPSIQRVFADSQLPPELLTLAWASVLGGYAGSEDVLFRVNDGAVRVNTSSGHVSKLSCGASDDGKSGATSITIVEDGDEFSPEQNGDSFQADALTPGSNGSNDQSITSFRHDSSSQSYLNIHYLASTGQITVNSRGLLPQHHLQELCHQVLTEISRSMQRGDSSPLTEKYASRLSIINAEPQLMPGSQLLHELLAPQRDSHGCALQYLKSDGQIRSLTYADLFFHANRLAGKLLHELRQQSSVLGRLVIPVLLPQCPELYITLLAILQIGAAFCPLGIDMPKERIEFIMEDIDAPLLVTSAKHTGLLPKSLRLDVCLVDDVIRDGLDLPLVQGSNEQDQLTFRQASPGDTAYVMYSKHSICRWYPPTS